MILAIGDLMLDVLLLPELTAPEQGSGIIVRGGGSAANTAAWIADGGGDATLVACIGTDMLGDMLATELHAAGVSSRVRRVNDHTTGAVVVEITPDGERIMRSSRGANQTLAPGDVLGCGGLEPDWIHLTGYALLGHAGLGLLRAASQLARETRAHLSFDPSSVGVIDAFGAAALVNALLESGARLLLPNALEAQALTGEQAPEGACRSLGADFPMVIVKNGERGSVHAERGGTVAVPAVPGGRRDATGAGDAFNAGVLLALSHRGTLDEAVRAGHVVGARAIDRYGGRP